MLVRGRRLLLALSAFAALAAAQAAERRPAFVRLKLAGVDIQDQQHFVKYDPKERYYLVASEDCDGASTDLALTPSPGAWGVKPDDKSIVRASLPRLRNGTGVNIGDTPAVVRRKLGARPWKWVYHRKLDERVWTYEAPKIPVRMRHGISRVRDYTATYIFEHGRLWSIYYNVAVPGLE